MSKYTPLKIEELKKVREPYKNIVTQPKKKLNMLDRLALWITIHVGSMGFFIVIFLWTVTWLGWNIIAPPKARFDPFPAFVFWLFISNMIQLFLMPLIMIGQNIQASAADKRAQADFEVNKAAEKEIETILMHLENQEDVLQQILTALNKADKNHND